MNVLVRSLLIQASWSFTWMQSLGFAYALLPVLKKLYPDEGEFASRLALHREYFNTQPYLASFILGATVRLEEERASGRDANIDVAGMKASLMPSLGALGDSFFWGALKPIAATAAVALVFTGFWWGPLVFLAFYNMWHVGLRAGLLVFGYRSSGQALLLIARFNFTRTARIFKAIAVSLLGGIAGLMLSWLPEFRAPIHAAGLWSLIAGGIITFGFLALMRKGSSPVNLMIGLAVICIILSSLGVGQW